nr:hypothetical protein [Phocid alphaherpesvirus 1]
MDGDGCGCSAGDGLEGGWDVRRLTASPSPSQTADGVEKAALVRFHAPALLLAPSTLYLITGEMVLETTSRARTTSRRSLGPSFSDSLDSPKILDRSTKSLSLYTRPVALPITGGLEQSSSGEHAAAGSSPGWRPGMRSAPPAVQQQAFKERVACNHTVLSSVAQLLFHRRLAGRLWLLMERLECGADQSVDLERRQSGFSLGGSLPVNAHPRH